MGAVTVGAGAALQPSVGVSRTIKLTLQRSVTFQADSTYIYKLDTQNGKGDQLVANGAIIASGAQFNLTALANRRLAAGSVFTAISNTSVTPISGTFAKLADGSILTAGRNNLLVSYNGADANDLTLTVQWEGLVEQLGVPLALLLRFPYLKLRLLNGDNGASLTSTAGNGIRICLGTTSFEFPFDRSIFHGLPRTSSKDSSQKWGG